MSFFMFVMLATLLSFPIVVGALALEEIRTDRQRSSRLHRSTQSQLASDY